MTRIRLSAAIAPIALLLVAGSTACKSTQPTENNSQAVSVAFQTTADLTEFWNCWDVWSDLNQDGVPENDLDRVYCENTGGFKNGRQAPWAYDTEISVIHAGETAEKIVASSVHPTGLETPGILPFDNVTPPDLELFSGAVLPASPKPQEVYLNPRAVSRSSPVYAKFANLTIPPPNVLGANPSFTFTVRKGDTIIVRARKIPAADWVVGLFPPTPEPGVKLFGSLTINGVLANTKGATSSSTDDAAGFTFSYTVR